MTVFFRNFHWSSRHLRPLLNREILTVEGLRLRIRSIVATESDAKPSASPISYFLTTPKRASVAIRCLLSRVGNRRLLHVTGGPVPGDDDLERGDGRPTTGEAA